MEEDVGTSKPKSMRKQVREVNVGPRIKQTTSI